MIITFVLLVAMVANPAFFWLFLAHLSDCLPISLSISIQVAERCSLSRASRIFLIFLSGHARVRRFPGRGIALINVRIWPITGDSLTELPRDVEEEDLGHELWMPSSLNDELMKCDPGKVLTDLCLILLTGHLAERGRKPWCALQLSFGLLAVNQMYKGKDSSNLAPWGLRALLSDRLEVRLWMRSFVGNEEDQWIAIYDLEDG
jgi:hypothetical protein